MLSKGSDLLGGVTPVLVAATPSLSLVRRLIRRWAVPALDVMVLAQIVFAAPSVEVGRPTPPVETRPGAPCASGYRRRAGSVGGGDVVVVLHPRLRRSADMERPELTKNSVTSMRP